MQSFAIAALVVSAASFEDETSVALLVPASSFDISSEDSLSLLQVRATQGCSPWDPYCGSPPDPDGQPDTDQTPTLAQNGPCVILNRPEIGYPKGHLRFDPGAPQADKEKVMKAQAACPNTVDNYVQLGDGDYPIFYPDWQCGQAVRLGGPHYGQVDSAKGWVNNGRTWDHLPDAFVKALPWLDHADACVAACKEKLPEAVGTKTFAVQVAWPYGSTPLDSAVVPKATAIDCQCNTAATFRVGDKPMDGCAKKVVWLGDPNAAADACPCTNGLSLTLKKPLHSNLGGAGPDVGSPPEILYPEAGVIDGQVVNVRVWTDDASYKGNGAKNGVKGSLGRLNMKTGRENTFQVAVVDAETKEPLKLGHALPMTFLDLDEGKNGKGRATVSVCGAQQFVTSSSELTVSSAGGCAAAASSARGNSQDNPSSVEGALTDDVASRRVASYILDATETGIYTFKLTVAKGYGKRNFLFSLSPGAACSDDTNMPTECAAALDSEGL